jgi:uncharacterized protein (DUF1800 family)
MTQQPDPLYVADVRAATTSEAQAPATPDATALLVGAAILLPAVLVGCGGGGGGGDSGPLPPALTITAIEVQAVTSPAGAAVTVDGRTQPASGGVNNALNGAVGREPDPGSKGATSSRSFLVHAAGGTQDLDITVTFNPSPATVAVLGLPGFTSFAESRHLAARTGFGGSWDDLMALMGVPYDTAIDLLVDGMRTTPVQGSPAWIDATILTWAEFSALSQAAQDAYNDQKWPRRNELKQWWLREIVQTSSPMTERLVAFWGNHFVVNIDDIEEPQLAWSWLTLLRTHASGNLRTFIHAMCLHPAMLLYLDNANNEKSRPPGVTTGPQNVPSNENFGRELLELFMLGEGQIYTEADVLAVARAFTGHNTDDRKAYLYKPTKHDALTDMTILGQGPAQFGSTSPTGGNVYDIIDVILEARVAPGDPPRTAQLVVEKLWAEFIGTTPTSGQINALAQVLYSNNWNLKPLYKALFKHSEFKLGATDLSRKLLKMPLELVAGFYRSLDIPPDNNDWSSLVWIHSEQDQDPLAPPIVKGWLGGTTWINAKSLVSRYEHFGWFGWYLRELGDANLPQYLMTGYTTFMLAVPRVFAEPTIYTWEPPLARRLQVVIQDPAYHMK